jgi:hypothetical protein
MIEYFNDVARYWQTKELAMDHITSHLNYAFDFEGYKRKDMLN